MKVRHREAAKAIIARRNSNRGSLASVDDLAAIIESYEPKPAPVDEKRIEELAKESAKRYRLSPEPGDDLEDFISSALRTLARENAAELERLRGEVADKDTELAAIKEVDMGEIQALHKEIAAVRDSAIAYRKQFERLQERIFAATHERDEAVKAERERCVSILCSRREEHYGVAANSMDDIEKQKLHRELAGQCNLIINRILTVKVMPERGKGEVEQESLVERIDRTIARVRAMPGAPHLQGYVKTLEHARGLAVEKAARPHPQSMLIVNTSPPHQGAKEAAEMLEGIGDNDSWTGPDERTPARRFMDFIRGSHFDINTLHLWERQALAQYLGIASSSPPRTRERSGDTGGEAN